MKIIENNKKEAERKFQLRQEAIQREREQRRLFHLEQRKEQMQHAAKIQSIQDKRNENINKIQQHRKEVGQAETQRALSNMKAADDAHSRAVAGWKEKRIEGIENEKLAKAEDAAHNEQLETRRQEAIDERIKSWENRKAAWLVRFKRDDDRRLKKERVLLEKKQEMIHELNVQRTKVWQELASLRKERDDVLRFCRGEDQPAESIKSSSGSASPALPAVTAGTDAEKIEESRRSSIKVSVAPSVLVSQKPAEIRKKRVQEKERRRNLEEAQRAAQLREKQKREEVKKEIEKKKREQEREERERQTAAKKLKAEQELKRKAKIREENIARRHAEKVGSLARHKESD
jgi:hypothetical protein